MVRELGHKLGHVGWVYEKRKNARVWHTTVAGKGLTIYGNTVCGDPWYTVRLDGHPVTEYSSIATVSKDIESMLEADAELSARTAKTLHEGLGGVWTRTTGEHGLVVWFSMIDWRHVEVQVRRAGDHMEYPTYVPSLDYEGRNYSLEEAIEDIKSALSETESESK